MHPREREKMHTGLSVVKLKRNSQHGAPRDIILN
jgi:hypothetical protein